jgi:GDP-L-fucose synthase
MSADTRIFIAGHRGLVASALWRHFTDHGFENLIGRCSKELDLRDARPLPSSSTRHGHKL